MLNCWCTKRLTRHLKKKKTNISYVVHGKNYLFILFKPPTLQMARLLETVLLGCVKYVE